MLKNMAKDLAFFIHRWIVSFVTIREIDKLGRAAGDTNELFID